MDVKLATIGKVLRQFEIDEWLFLTRLAGSHHAAFVLRKIMLWNDSSTAQERDGWFHKSHSQMGRETGLSPYQIRKAQEKIARFVEIDLRPYKGKDYTWYRLKAEALLEGVSQLLAKMTGKMFDLLQGVIGSEPVRNLRRSGLKNLTRQTLTPSNSNRSDDDVIDLPPAFRKFAFKGLRDDVRLLKEIERLGTDKALEVLERCVKFGGKRWGYVWTSLEGEEPGAVKSEPQRRKDTEAQREADNAGIVPTGEDVPVMSLINPDLEAWRAQWADERERNKPWAEKQEAIAPATEAVERVAYSGLTWREAFELAWGQLQLQFDRATFDTWLKDARIVDVEEGVPVFEVPNQYAEEKINKWLYRNIRRVISDVLNRQVELRAVTNWGAV